MPAKEVVENKDVPADTTIVSRYSKQFTKKQIIDLYYVMICDHYIIVEKELLEKYILNEEITDQQPLKKEMNAFFHSIQALLEQRFGFCEIAEKSAKKSRDLLSKIFDQVSNYYVACCYSSLGIYEIGTGRGKLAKFYIKTAKFYFDGIELEKLNNSERLLLELISVMELMIEDDLGTNKILKDFPSYFYMATSTSVPQQFLEKIPQQVDLSNLETYLEVICQSLKEFFISKAKSTRSQFDLIWYSAGSNYYFEIVHYGLKLLFLIQNCPEYRSEIEQTACKITLLSDSEYFPFTTFAAIPYFTMASRVHVQVAKEIEKGLRSNLSYDIYSMITKDYRSLHVLKSRYKRVNVVAGSVILEMEEILKKRDIEPIAQAEHNSVYSPLTNFLDMLFNPDDSFSTSMISSLMDPSQDKI